MKQINETNKTNDYGDIYEKKLEIIDHNKYYWDTRLKNNFSRTGSGAGTSTPGGGCKINKYLYNLREYALERAINKFNIKLKTSDVIDIGCGTGYWTEFFHKRNVNRYVGIDIAPVAKYRLSKQFPQYEFWELDIGDVISEVLYRNIGFDLIIAFDVLYHIVDDQRFVNVMENLRTLAKPGGHLLITDYFFKQEQTESHVKHRNLEHYVELLKANNFELLDIIPCFYLLGRIISQKSQDQNFITNLFLYFLYYRGLLSFFLYYADKILVNLIKSDNKKSKTKLLIARYDSK